jgi:hypothetical protein
MHADHGLGAYAAFRQMIIKKPIRGLIDFDDKTLTPEPGHY